MPPVGFEHGDVAGHFCKLLREFVDTRHLGKVVLEVGFVLGRHPDTVRAPDIAFLSRDKLTGVPLQEFVPFAPDLAVEVLSPDDTRARAAGKAREYVAAGTRLVWLLDPRGQRVHIFDASGSRALGIEDTLDGGEVLPGFAARVGSLFP